MIERLYHYKAICTRVIDGDTIVATIDLGFNLQLCDRTIRLLGINAPEIRWKDKEQGLISKDWLKEKIEGKEIIIRTISTDAFGRWLAVIYLDGQNICEQMIANGLATEYK